MTREELMVDLLKGILLIVGEYRGSYAELAGYVDKKSGEAIQHVRAIHLAECAWCGHIDRVIVTEYFPGGVTVDQAQATFKYARGRLHVFYLEWFKRERGQTFARLSAWGIEEIEGIGAAAAPSGAPPPSNLVLLETTPQREIYDEE
jgi:hypothetical protein